MLQHHIQAHLLPSNLCTKPADVRDTSTCPYQPQVPGGGLDGRNSQRWYVGPQQKAWPQRLKSPQTSTTPTPSTHPFERKVDAVEPSKSHVTPVFFLFLPAVLNSHDAYTSRWESL